MKIKTFKIPIIPQAERTVIVDELLEIIKGQQENIEILTAEINRLKGLKSKPNIKPNTLDKDKSNSGNNNKGKRGKNNSSNNKPKLPPKEVAVREEVVKAENVPTNAKFKGYAEYTVQELIIKAEKIIYKLEQWQLPDGSYITAKLPAAQQDSHYGPVLRSYIKYQYYYQEVTEPLILGFVQELGIKISEGELDKLLKHQAEPFHKEKDDILAVGLAIAKYIHADDTGARHKGKNGYCTHIGNELFAWFKSTESKSRLNFLEILSQGHPEYVFTPESFDYMERNNLAPWVRNKIKAMQDVFANIHELDDHLQTVKIINERHSRIILEAGLIGALLKRGLFKDTVIITDDAGQFNIFKHALCWIHSERNIKKIIANNDDDAKAINNTLDEIWEFYRKLKQYKLEPSEFKKIELRKEFNNICFKKTCCYALNKQLKKLKKDEAELLLVLERPDIPLHNNLSDLILENM